MAQQTFALSAAALSAVNPANVFVSGSSYQWMDKWSEVQGVFGGTGIEVQTKTFGANNPQNTLVYVDGVLVTGAFASSDFTGFLTLATGLTDAQHTLRILSQGDQAYALVANAAFRVTGSAPTLGPPAVLGGTIIQFGTSPVGVDFGPSVTSGASGVGQGFGAGTNHLDCGIRVVAQTPNLSLHALLAGYTFNLQVDGVDAQQITVSGNSGTYTQGWFTFTGLDATKPHSYLITCCHTVATYGRWFGAIAASAGGTIRTSTIAKRKSIAFLGDSITQTDNVANATSSLTGFPHLVGKLLNVNVVNCGISGSTANGAGGTVVADLAAWSVKPDLVSVEWGTNDRTANESAATFQSSVSGVLAGVRAASSAPINWWYLLPRDDQNPAVTVAAYNAAIDAAVAAGDAGMRAIDPNQSGIVFTADFSNADGGNHIHPLPAGDAKLAAWAAGLYAPLFGNTPAAASGSTGSSATAVVARPGGGLTTRSGTVVTRTDGSLALALGTVVTRPDGSLTTVR